MINAAIFGILCWVMVSDGLQGSIVQPVRRSDSVQVRQKSTGTVGIKPARFHQADLHSEHSTIRHRSYNSDKPISQSEQQQTTTYQPSQPTSPHNKRPISFNMLSLRLIPAFAAVALSYQLQLGTEQTFTVTGGGV